MYHRAIGRLSATALIATVLVLATITWSSPRETPTTLGGIGIGDEASGFARISFRHLACTVLVDVAPDPQGIRVDGMRCTTPVAGKLLIIEAERFDPHRRIGFRRCTALYGERIIDCEDGGFTSGGPRYALIPAAALGIDAGALATIKRANPFEQIPSDTWRSLLSILAGLLSTSLGIALAAHVRRSLVTFVASASVAAVVLFPLSWFCVMLVIGHFID